MSKILIQLKNTAPRIDFPAFSQPINWEITNDEHWAVLGANGAGKNIFSEILMRKYSLKSGEISYNDDRGFAQNNWNFVKLVSFKDIYTLANNKNSYYQQRWNIGLEEDIPMVKNLLDTSIEIIQELVDLFQIHDLLEKKIHQLSSGELRKVIIIQSLASNPRILILDNLFIGLDVQSRTLLSNALTNLSALKKLQIIILAADIADIPPFITHILPIKGKEALLPVTNTQANHTKLSELLFPTDKSIPITIPKLQKENVNFKNALDFKNITIKYGDSIILENISWKVRKGEKWALLGENGSGKSTLLSLVTADNPQGYANDLTLFDRKRGTGESIWDIKKHIGYISPEMHLYYRKNASCLDIVCSGFFDTIGLYQKSSSEQTTIALEWMKLLGIENLKDTSFLKISNGEQRLVLLARVFVKNPELVILDEPMHGLDTENKKFIKKVIEKFCTQDKALIYVTHYKEEIPETVTQQLVLTKTKKKIGK